MRRRFENVNMVMGNCFSPVMEGSQFKWNNIVVNSPVYITPIRRKKFKMVIIYHFTPPRIPINSPNVDTGLL